MQNISCKTADKCTDSGGNALVLHFTGKTGERHCGKSNHIVKQNDNNNCPKGNSVGKVVCTENKLDEGISEAGDSTVAHAVKLADDNKGYHTAKGDGAAEGQRDLKQAQNGAEGYHHGGEYESHCGVAFVGFHFYTILSFCLACRQITKEAPRLT